MLKTDGFLAYQLSIVNHVDLPDTVFLDQSDIHLSHAETGIGSSLRSECKAYVRNIPLGHRRRRRYSIHPTLFIVLRIKDVIGSVFLIRR